MVGHHASAINILNELIDFLHFQLLWLMMVNQLMYIAL